MLDYMKLVVFFGNGEGELPDEVEYLSGILTGEYAVNAWQGKRKKLTSLSLKEL